MTAYDELRKALPYAEAWGAASRSLAFRRIAELLVRARGTDDIDLRVHAVATLERLRPQVSTEARRDVIKLAAEHWPDRTMRWLFRHEPPEALAPLLAKAGRSSPAPPVPGPATAPMHPAIEDAASAIRRLEARLNPPAEPEPAAQLAGLAGEWRWECDAHGVIGYSEGGPGGAVALFDLDAADLIWPAFTRRAPFRGIEVRVGDQTWTLAGVPFFDRGAGRFVGYRGTAARVAGYGLFGTAASGDAFAKLAHEVRSPLNAIMGFAQMIESETLGAAPEPYRRRAGAILDHAHRLLGALDDLTDSARLDRGQWPVASEPVDVGALVGRLAERYRAVANARGVVIAASVAPGLPPGLSDPRALDRAVKRLLAAVIATAESGEALLLGAQRAGGDVRLFLTRPSALDELSADALFDTANVAPEGTTAPLLGLGFGLRLVRRLVEAMGGRFDIEPTRFTLTLPAAPKADDTADGASEQPVANRDQNA